MGCSPSHAVIINQSPTQETICLQPKIYMVSESTLCLLRDVGELRVYQLDERNPETAIERFRGAQDQLSNPLLFHPQVRGKRRERLNTGDPQSTGLSSLASEQENVRVRIEVAQDEERSDGIDELGSNTSDNVAVQTETVPESPNAHSVTVEVYSYKQNLDGNQDESVRKENFVEVENHDSEPQKVENDDAHLVAVTAAQQNDQTSDGQDEPREINDGEAINSSDELDEPKDATLAWAAETVDKAEGRVAASGANQNTQTDQAVFTRNKSESGKETVNQDIELLENVD